MDTSLNRALTSLHRGAVLGIADGRGKGIAVFSGSVWITQDNDLDDHFLGYGQTMLFDRPGKVVVQALANSAVLVFGAEPQGVRADRSRRIDSLTLHQQARRLRTRALALAGARLGAALGRGWQRLRRALAGAGTAASRPAA